MRKKYFLLMCFLGVSAIASLAAAVGTSYWQQTNETDFKAGTLDNVVATNLGDLKLSRAVKTLLEQDPQVSSVNVLAEAPDGTIYAGTGPNAVLLQLKDEKVTTAATIADAAAVLSLVVQSDGAVILGTGGEAGRVLKIDKAGAKPHVLLEAEGVQYVWGLAQTPDGNIYAATGPHGQLFEIRPDGGKRMVLDSQEGNLLSLVSDGKDTLYVGTDPHGLVYRVNRKTGESFVLYNAAESEVSALTLDKSGNLYAGTSETREEPLIPTASPAGEKGGRPEQGGSGGVPIPADRPKEPSPPQPPNPNPGQPEPIPKSPQVRLHDAQFMRQSPAYLVSNALGDSGQGSFTRAALLRNNIIKANRNSFIPRDGMAADAATRKHVISARKHVVGNADPTPIASGFLVADTGRDNFASLDSPNKRKNPHPGPGNPNPAPSPQPGKPDAPATQAARPPQPVHQPTVDTTIGAEPRADGNAIYKIDPDGFVTEVFRQPVLILSMVENNGTLLIATGGTEGQVYQIRPADEETIVLAKVDPKQIMCLLPTHDGKVYMGTANVGTVAVMSGGVAEKGTYVSAVLDATQISRFGKIHLHGTLAAHSSLSLATRSGNVKDADEKTWSKWSDEAPAVEFMKVAAPTARFLQYRLTFSSTDGKSTPVVRDVSVAYQMPNLPPSVKAVKLATSSAGVETDVDASPRRIESARHQTISWEASDPNGDALAYSLLLRPLGEEKWIVIKEKLTDTTYEWDTRTVADGRYEVKIIASDGGANPPGQGKTASRVSDPVTVDNTPPTIGDVKSTQLGNEIHIDLKVVDRTSTVAAVDYSVDSNRDWQFVLPTDQIYDSPEETVSIAIPGLKPGQHQVTLRATDSKGNQSFENVFVTVHEQAAAK